MLYVCDQLVKFLRHFLVIGYLHGDDIIMPRAIIVFPQARYNSHNSIATLRKPMVNIRCLIITY